MSNQKQNPSTAAAAAVSPFDTLTITATVQILRSFGFKSAKTSALQTLTRVATLFIQSLATSAAAHATFTCRRTHCNIFDVIYAIEDLSHPFGFSGASSIDQPLLASKTLEDLRHFISAIDDHQLLFRRRLRLSSSSSTLSSVIFAGNNHDRRRPEVPRWLPPCPEVREGEDCKKKGDKECLWEEKEINHVAPRKEKVRKGGKEVVVQGRRERVRFKLKRRGKNVNVGGFNDLELQNGVCRGGKSVCLVKRVDNISRFFQDDDDDDDEDNGEKDFNIGL